MIDPPHVIVLASRHGGTPQSVPSVLEPVLFRPMIAHVLDLVSTIPHRSVCVVTGPGETAIKEKLSDYHDIEHILQDAWQGTGRAVSAAEPFFDNKEGDILILHGDNILLTRSSVVEMLQTHVESRAACTIGAAIGESADEEALETNGRIYVFRMQPLFDMLQRAVSVVNSYDLPDAIKLLKSRDFTTARFHFNDPEEIAGISDYQDLSKAESLLRDRTNRHFMLKGARLVDPHTTSIDPRCNLAAGVHVEGGAALINSTLEQGARVEAFCRVADSFIGRGSLLKQGSYIESSRVGRDCLVGPYAHIRSGSDLKDRVWAGNFVEIKNSRLGAGTKAAHLSYIGDADIGKNVNIGCGFITCNSDGGPVKQRTVIEDDVFIGSDSQAIAPVRLGARSFIATGTSVTEDVPPDSFVISRGRQVTKAGYARKYKKAKEPVHSH